MMMAGDWIPAEVGLFKKREVMTIARLTKRSRHEIGGLLLEFWGWFSTESAGPSMPGIGVENLPDIIGGDLTFWRAVVSVGWLIDHGDDGIEIPKADHWISCGAKARLQKSRRQRTWRDSTRSTDEAEPDLPGISTVDPAASTEESTPASRALHVSVSSSSPNGKGGAGGKPKASKFVPDGFVLTDELRAYAKKQGLTDAAVSQEWEKFRLHEFASPKTNWPYTWMRWARTAVERRQQGRPGRPGQTPDPSGFVF